MLQDGETAPDFELPSETGKTVRLSKLKGRPVVIYFYPKDDTPGCTTEAKDFSEFEAKFKKAGAEIFGISPDSVASHEKFCRKHSLSVTLLADEEQKAANAYGVWTEKSMYGKKYMGIERSTFLIDAKGKVARSWRKVKVPGHAEEVFEAVKSLKA
jgi:thioredoxin-dependent peroxiredoxin